MTNDEELDRDYDAAYFYAMRPSEGLLPARRHAALKEYEDLIMRSMVDDDLLSQSFFTGSSAPNSNGSSTWSTKTPAEILADVNMLLVSAYDADARQQETAYYDRLLHTLEPRLSDAFLYYPPFPSLMLIPYRAYQVLWRGSRGADYVR